MFGGTLAAGPYTVTWNSLALGIMVGDEKVPTIRHKKLGKRIDNTDQYGQLLLGSVYRGVQAHIVFTCQEYKSQVISALWPYGAEGVIGVIGRDDYDMAQALVMAAVAGIPAATNPASITASKAFLTNDFETVRQYGPQARETPLDYELMPYTSTGSTVLYTTT